MYRMQSGGWPYSEDGRDSSKALSLHVAFLRTAVFPCTHDKLMIALWQNDSIVMYHKKSAVPVLIPRPHGRRETFLSSHVALVQG